MPLHFTDEEFASRKSRVLDAMAQEDLDLLLAFKPETHFWLTGFDTFGYCFFQCLVITRDGRVVLLTRSADRLQAKLTSTIEDVRIWVDGASAEPVVHLAALIQELGGGRRIGVELDTAGLSGANALKVAAMVEGLGRMVDASLLVSRLRVVKSEAELAAVRKAAELGDAALDAAIRTTRAGTDEADILAAMQGAVLAGSGDYPGNPFIIGSGETALLCRYKTGRRRLDPIDQLTIEFAGVWRQYHSALMRTLLVGKPGSRHEAMFEAAKAALLACEAKLVPGNRAGDVFDAHAKTLEGHGFGHAKLNACGYSLGAVYAPCWMDWPMFYEDNPAVIAPNMVFFLHMILMDETSGEAMCLGRTSIVTETGAEPLSKAPLEMIVL